MLHLFILATCIIDLNQLDGLPKVEVCTIPCTLHSIYHNGEYMSHLLYMYKHKIHQK